ncbi:alpha/beta fold hydrolase [Streptomyces sp. TRM64462]|uniref:alpha/beta fold hydrolase n=1 Tax=Streptomyces sp. TRM64462 TaxID=2741726 RepID=UPI0015865D5D|nr:alpha/beta fold hydrolase [Streptomyces sp. TRM64462]
MTARQWLRRRRWAAVGGALALVGGLLTWTATAAGDPVAVERQERFLTGAGGVRLDTSYYLAGGGDRPAVILAHGFGGTKDSEREQAERLARAGYAVLTYSARGFGASGGRIGLNAADGEVADVRRLVDWLAARPEVRKDGAGDPVVGMAGGSYGGAVSLLAAAQDRRVDAIVPSITYWDLEQALFPQGVFKKLWAGIFFSRGLTDPRDPRCGRFTPEVCVAFQRSAVAGRADPATRALLRGRSPAAYGPGIAVPTLVVQGQTDSLFPLDQGDAIARAVAANGAPVAVDWAAGGHDGGGDEAGRIHERTVAWFDAHLKGGGGGAGGAGGGGPAFRVTRTGGAGTESGEVTLRGATAARYPGLGGTSRTTVALDGGERTLVNPAGGTPPGLTGLPGLGGTPGLSALAGRFDLGAAWQAPGGSVAFTSAPLKAPLHVTGAAAVDLTVRAEGRAVLFAKLYDVAPDGRGTMPRQLAAPVSVAGGATSRVRLPAVDHRFDAGHRVRVVLSSTDLGFASPAEPAVYRVRAGALTLPSVPELAVTDGATVPWWTWALPGVAVLVAAALWVTRGRAGAAGGGVRAAGSGDVGDEVPLRVSGLTKRYAGGGDAYAVRELSFTVERGQVLGLLGPNGAGKTTTLRMLMGLVRPDAGELRIFGRAVRPGAPVLSRLGSFVEGPGFLPHLTGRQNLDLYWRATGRPAADAHREQALEIAALGTALDRPVRTYSQGMRQRLAIAQAMLGLPDLLVLDEPTNGLDPGQIREMRDVLTRYAATGRTVIVSSHLLAEVEQCCTHLVVMDRGRLVASGPVGEITGDDDHLLVATPHPVDAALAAKVAGLPGVGTARAVDEGLLVRLTAMSAAELVVELVRMEVPVERIGPYRRLEDAFLTLIGGGER